MSMPKWQAGVQQKRGNIPCHAFGVPFPRALRALGAA